MTFNLIFVTVSINKKNMTIEEIENQQRIKSITEANKDRQISYYHHI